MSDEPGRSPADLLADLQSDDVATATRAMREVLAIQLLTADDASKAASVAKVLRDVLSDLDDMKPAEGSATDELLARRAARGTPVPDGAAGSDDGGSRRRGGARGKRGAAS